MVAEFWRKELKTGELKIMKNEIIGNRYRYIIDTSYGINKDGFIPLVLKVLFIKG